jgi:NADPH:quinone reductase-like Zn-dependent oxidoreductase
MREPSVRAIYQALVMPEAGAPLVLVERPWEPPGPGEAVVRVRAVSLNYHDLVNLMGLLKGPNFPWPRVPMSDGAGEVVAVAPDVETISVGDRVMGAFHPQWLAGPPTPEAKRSCPGDTGDGWLQQYVRFSTDALVATPAHLSDAEAATLPCAATTAWSALEIGGVTVGDIVVTQGTGGVSLFAVQLAKARGAAVILTSSSDAKLAIGEQLGADHLINYRSSPDWEREVRRITHGHGADLVVDLGGPETLPKSVVACRMDGTVAIVGVLSGFGSAQLPVGYAMTHNTHLVGVSVGSVAALTELCAVIADAKIRPQISHTFDWTELAEATRVMQANEHVGKIVVRVR